MCVQQQGDRLQPTFRLLAQRGLERRGVPPPLRLHARHLGLEPLEICHHLVVGGAAGGQALL
jgi:hypothetical protein